MDREHSRTQVRIWAIISLISLLLFIGLKVISPEQNEMCLEDETTCACKDSYEIFDTSSAPLLAGMLLYLIWRVHMFFFVGRVKVSRRGIKNYYRVATIIFCVIFVTLYTFHLLKFIGFESHCKDALVYEKME